MIKTMKSSNSIGYFNLARGIGMLMIVLEHTMQNVAGITAVPTETTLFAGTAGVLGGGLMAMFFLISGYGFFKSKPKKCVKLQAKLLLKPYYIVVVLILLTRIVLAILKRRSFWEHSGYLVFTYLFALNATGGDKMLFGIPISGVGIFWFLWATFGGWNIYNGICQIKNEKLQWFFVAVSVVTGYLMTLVSKTWPFALPMALLCTGYIAAGTLMRKKKLLERKLPIWIYALLIIPVVVSCAWGQVNFFSCVWKLGLVDILSTYCVGFLLLKVFAVLNNLRGNNFVTRMIENIGFKSIWILCIHGYEQVIVPWYRLAGIFQGHTGARILLCLLIQGIVIWGLYKGVSWFNGQLKKKKRKGKQVIV